MLNRVSETVIAGQTAKVGGTDLRRQYNVVRRRWKAILAVTIAAIVGTFLALLFITPRFTANTQVLFDPRKQNVFQLQNAQNAGQGSIDIGTIESEVSLMQSFNVLLRVVNKLELDKVAEFQPSGSSFPFSLFGSSPRAAASDETPDGKITREQIAAIRILKANLTARRVGLTYVVEIGATSADKVLAAKISDAVAAAYLVEQLEARYEVSRRASDWFSERLISLRTQLQDSEKKVADYRTQFGLVDTQQGGTIDKQQMSELSAQLVMARAQTAEKRAKFEQADRANRASGSNAALPEILSSGLISSLRSQEAEVARREADLLAKYNASHPSVVNVRAERADIRRAISNEVQRVIASFKNEYEVAQKREQSLEDSLSRATSFSGANDSVKIKLRELERDVDSNRALYDSFLSHAKEAREQTTLDTNDSRVISPAVVPTAPSFPKKSVFLGLATLLGLLGGVGLAFMLDYMERGFVTAEQLEAATDLPVLATLPSLDAKETLADGQPLTIPEYVRKKPLTRFSESVRSVRVAVSLSDVDNPPRVVLLTSSVPSEGKSTIATSIAVSAAASGQKVLLIDGDLRHPSTSKFFALEKSTGLVDLLSGGSASHETMRLFIDGRLTVLPAGSETKNAPDLLSSQKMIALLAAARQNYDLVIVDTPPVTAVVDSQVVANHVDKIVFVVEWERTPREVVERAMNVIAEHRPRIAGLVLNKADTRQMRYHSSYYSYYNNAYRDYYKS